MRKAEIYCDNVYAGLLTEISRNEFSFKYDKNYVNSSNQPVSLTLPKRYETYTSACLFPCFANMLPEGANKSTVCRIRKIDENDTFGLLLAFSGKDFIGNIDIKDISE